MNPYTPLSHLSIEVRGFAQKGYESILRKDTWLEQKCIKRTKTEGYSVDKIEFKRYDHISVADLRAFVAKVERAGIEEIPWDYELESCDDGGADYVTSVELDARAWREVPMTENDLYRAYIEYVDSVIQKNKDTYNTFVREQRKAVQQQDVKDKERQEYLRLRALYKDELG